MIRRSVLVVLGGALVVGSAWARPGAPDRGSAATHVIEMRGFAFVPARLEAAVGDTVVWINRDAAPHTATDSADVWDSGDMAKGARWSLVLEETGRAPYVCVYHPAMRGTLLVRAADGSDGRKRDE